MRVIIGKSVYDMDANQLDGVLKIASKQVPFGIYAVTKNDICELHNDKFDSKEKLMDEVNEYTKNGYIVYYNC